MKVPRKAVCVAIQRLKKDINVKMGVRNVFRRAVIAATQRHRYMIIVTMILLNAVMEVPRKAVCVVMLRFKKGSNAKIRNKSVQKSHVNAVKLKNAIRI